MVDLTTYMKERGRQVQSALDQILQRLPDPNSRLHQAMRYALMSGGKRLRPVLCLSACESVGGSPDAALPAACALEMSHTYSRIQDDLPAMDNDTLRRGRPTCHIAFDEATAILAGDALLTLAFETLASPCACQSTSIGQWLEIVSMISKAAGSSGMVEGQMRDMLAEQQAPLSLPELELLHRLKTGRLIEAAVCSGAMLGQGTPEQLDRLGAYARGIGLAFQITDDMLNVEGDPAVMGKGAGTDRHRSKSTYPSLLGMAASREKAAYLIDQAVELLAPFDRRADPLRALAGYILERNR